jgi:hypothetical protein
MVSYWIVLICVEHLFFFWFIFVRGLCFLLLFLFLCDLIKGVVVVICCDILYFFVLG